MAIRIGDTMTIKATSNSQPFIPVGEGCGGSSILLYWGEWRM